MSVRVRFAPSPTGVLHIGGVRTALYNYLFARQHGGQFILRIEDTDQGRYVPGAEQYIIDTLRWFNLIPDEGVGFGGDKGPYRQSDRKAIYAEQAQQLVARGHAYLAFDTPEELETKRAEIENFTYNFHTRSGLRNSLTLSASETADLKASGVPYVIRLKVEPGRDVVIRDLVRGTVVIQTDGLDDKVLLKADGMPTYHLANIMDDHMMKITHVIRGEEWLPSTAHHILLYEGFGWADTMPQFAHLPLILKPFGDGKLSKRDGAKFGFPVFPLAWAGSTPEERIPSFQEAGFLPEAVINFLALLGWHPSNEQEIFSIDQLIEAFSIPQISKGGARFDYEKAKWFNQKYIIALDNETLAQHIRLYAEAAGYTVNPVFLSQVAGLMKERVTFLSDFTTQGYYLFEPVRDYDTETIAKKWNPASTEHYKALAAWIEGSGDFSDGHALETGVKQWIQEQGLKPGDWLPLLRLALAGTMKGPAVFDMAVVLGREETVNRLQTGLRVFEEVAVKV
jgi:glutamyl-tRNA synthetase